MAARIAVDADLGRLGAVRGFVREATAGVMTPEDAADLVQAVDEIVTNVIEHGYAGRDGKVEVELEAAPDGDGVIVRVRDACPPFDPTVVPTPDTAAPLDERPLGGMGVHLSRELTDAMTHRILPSGGNELTLVKRLSVEGRGERDGDPG